MYKCGYITGLETDNTRPNWRNDGARPIHWSAWYPACEMDGVDSGRLPKAPFFGLGEIYPEAHLASDPAFPVVLLSHGTGGTAESLGWLARELARRGYVVIGANHHGNSGMEPYQPEGFLCWWERAADMSALLSSLSVNGVFAGRLDIDRVSAIGFSLGGYTVMALAGARTSLAEFNAWRSANKITSGGPKEYPDAADHIPDLLSSSDAFKWSWERHAESFADARVNAVIAIAAAPPVRAFTPQSVSRIEIPVTLITGGADSEAPTDECSCWLVKQNARFYHHDLGANVGHYTFLEFPADKSLFQKSDIFTDHPSVDRAAVHANAVELSLSVLA